MKEKTFQPDRVFSYFKAEWKVLLVVTVFGLIYNVGLLARPWFEGRMAGYLVKVLNGTGTFSGMRRLVCAYVAAIATVQISRYIKRFYVRQFCEQCEPENEADSLSQPCPKEQDGPCGRRRRGCHDEGNP